MSRLLVFNFDGTGNEPEDAKQKELYGEKVEDDSISNILKLQLMMGGNLFEKGSESYGTSTRDSVAHCFYYQGVGTYGNKFRRALNQGLAIDKSDVSNIIKSAQEDFDGNYKVGDLVLLTGFSRGAALARRFAALISDNPKTKNTKKFIFLCVFDTVASFGFPDLSKKSRPKYDVLFENGCTVASKVIQAAHMVSLDDKRSAFQPTLMNYQKEVVREIWFAGAHSDVGGGYNHDGLSDIALGYAIKWIHQMSKKPNLTMNLPYIQITLPDEKELLKALPDRLQGIIDTDDIERNPDPMAKSHEQDRGLIGKQLLDDRLFCVINNQKQDKTKKPILHWSVAERIHRNSNYRPTSLKNQPHIVWYQFEQKDVETKGYKAHVEHARLNWQTLEVGEETMVAVESELPYNYTGIMMTDGESYQISAVDGDFWWDKSIKCDANGWNRKQLRFGVKRALIASFASQKRLPKDEQGNNVDWFVLCATIGNDDSYASAIGNQGLFKATKSGELTLFANDMSSKYGNNSGEIRVTIKRIS